MEQNKVSSTDRVPMIKDRLEWLKKYCEETHVLLADVERSVFHIAGLPPEDSINEMSAPRELNLTLRGDLESLSESIVSANQRLYKLREYLNETIG